MYELQGWHSERKKALTEEFKKFDEPESFSLQVHGWFLPNLKKLRAEKYLKKNKTKEFVEGKFVVFHHEKWKYIEGETEADGKAHGNGIARLDNPQKEYRGTFLDDLPHGFGILAVNKNDYSEGEWRLGLKHGK